MLPKFIILTVVSITCSLFTNCGLDTDGDGTPDIEDLCPIDPGKTVDLVKTERSSRSQLAWSFP